MPNILQFVDSISATATVRLDLNDFATHLLGRGFDFSPPRLRRIGAESPFTDGSHISSTTYDNRTVSLPLHLLTAPDVDSLLAMKSDIDRELNRETNFLRIQRTGQSAPRYLRTFRSEVSDSDRWTDFRSLRQLEILAEPFAYGVRVDSAAATITNDPAAATNGLYMDIVNPSGDVPTPIVLWQETTGLPMTNTWIGARSRTVADLFWVRQAESFIPDADTSVVAVAGSSGGSVLRTTFATLTSPQLRLYSGFWAAYPAAPSAVNMAAARGTYRVLVRCKQTTASDVITVSIGSSTLTTSIYSTVTLASSTKWQVIDLGLVDVPNVDGPSVGLHSASQVIPLQMRLFAGRTSGVGSLDWDYAVLMPADESLMSGVYGTVADSVNRVTTSFLYTTSLFASDAYRDDQVITQPRGGWPTISPGATNRIYLLEAGLTTALDPGPITLAVPYKVSYWPRYLTV